MVFKAPRWVRREGGIIPTRRRRLPAFLDIACLQEGVAPSFIPTPAHQSWCWWAHDVACEQGHAMCMAPGPPLVCTNLNTAGG